MLPPYQPNHPVIGTIMRPTPLPKPLLVTPMRKTNAKMTSHQGDIGARRYAE
jgi:hypothetical protein